MSDFFVALDKDGTYGRSIEMPEASGAVEKWAAWYCAHTTEYGISECYVRRRGADWVKFNVSIESLPIFHASKAE